MEGEIDLEEDKEILYLLDIAINSYIENEQLKSELGYTRRLNYTGDHIPRID